MVDEKLTPPPIVYEKTRKKDGPELPSINVSSAESSAPILAPGTPTLGSTRKISSRRKALQDFYKLHAENAENGKTDKQEAVVSNDSLSRAEQLKNPEEFTKFMRSAPMAEILRLRNATAGTLSQHDLEKKTMIYDNFSELIRLSLVLNELKLPRKPDLDFADPDENLQVTDEFIRQNLGGLKAYLAGPGAVFNQDLVSVVNDILSEGDSDTASIQGIRGAD